MPKRLGELLLQDGVITIAQLHEAVTSQVIFATRLGSSLLDLGYIDEITLTEYLSEQSGFPAPPPEALLDISPEATGKLSAGTAAQCRAVPFRTSAKGLDVAMLDPGDDDARTTITIETGLEVETFVIPEMRLLTLLDLYYGIKPDMRSINLTLASARATGRKPQTEEEAQAATGESHHSDQTSMTPERFFIRPRDLVSQKEAEEDILLLTEIVDQEPDIIDEIEAAATTPTTGSANDWQIGRPQQELLPFDHHVAEVDRLTLDDSLAALEEARDSRQVAAIVLRFASTFFRRTALFVVRDDLALGWHGRGENLSRGLLELIMIPLGAESVFKLVHDGCCHYIGPLKPSPIHNRLLRLLGNVHPHTVCLLPILAAGRLVNILYGDNGEAGDVPSNIDDLLLLVSRLPHVYSRLIDEKKRHYELLTGSAHAAAP